MRIGRRYSRSAGTRSPATPAGGATDWFGTVRTVSPAPGFALGVAGAAPASDEAGAAATAGAGIPSTGTGPGGGAVGSGFPSASTIPASQGAAVAGAVFSHAAPLGGSRPAPGPEAGSVRLASTTATSGGC